jgi:hypothetical protein
MHIFIWEDIEYLTTRYHSDGGAVAIAMNIAEAIDLVVQEVDNRGYDADLKMQFYGANKDLRENLRFIKPTVVLALSSNHVSTAWIFPNAGCC